MDDAFAGSGDHRGHIPKGLFHAFGNGDDGLAPGRTTPVDQNWSVAVAVIGQPF
ncbi:hypothetical protein [Aestuariicoccus sp. MJ-SS9]|uniref:hypothetical protein n=1 Tax=Aestuariicoccus sp. MJ-SS9 TaxID=3079855 RepID=UPI00290D170F|nr:hypothetical protein [Aestuariicoccus sp. MJ-SS9]MDU8910370.1 hypothetical protein [Aestuariicoccus sp. MJ-SS9]